MADYQNRPYTMPFGKYKGLPIERVEIDYLRWLWYDRKGEPLRRPLRDHVRRILNEAGYGIQEDVEDAGSGQPMPPREQPVQPAVQNDLPWG